MTKTIPLSQGKVALVDDEDFERISKYKWHAESGGGTWYAYTNVRTNSNKYTTLAMHRLIMDAAPGTMIDHRDHDGLNNRRSNLRFSTAAGNQRNRMMRSDNTSGYKGVSWHKGAHKWAASIRFNGKIRHLGVFENPIDAARAYNGAAIVHFGDFAYINKIPE